MQKPVCNTRRWVSTAQALDPASALPGLAGCCVLLLQGKGLRHKVVGLKPNAEYVFCVKATYEDGSHLWSESRAFRTRMA